MKRFVGISRIASVGFYIKDSRTRAEVWIHRAEHRL